MYDIEEVVSIVQRVTRVRGTPMPVDDLFKILRAEMLSYRGKAYYPGASFALQKSSPRGLGLR